MRTLSVCRQASPPKHIQNVASSQLSIITLISISYAASLLQIYISLKLLLLCPSDTIKGGINSRSTSCGGRLTLNFFCVEIYIIIYFMGTGVEWLLQVSLETALPGGKCRNNVPETQNYPLLGETIKHLITLSRKPDKFIENSEKKKKCLWPYNDKLWLSCRNSAETAITGTYQGRRRFPVTTWLLCKTVILFV